MIYIEQQYRGYIVGTASTETIISGEWMGHYRVHKGGPQVFIASVAETQKIRTIAEASAMVLAKNYVDGLIAK